MALELGSGASLFISTSRLEKCLDARIPFLSLCCTFRSAIGIPESEGASLPSLFTGSVAERIKPGGLICPIDPLLRSRSSVKTR